MRLYLASRGIAVPAAVSKRGIGNTNFRVKDPEGHDVEFVQYEPESATGRDRGKHMPDGRLSKRMMHVGVIVTTFEPAMKFYRDILGLNEFWRGTGAGRTELSWVNMRLPDSDDYVELMLYKEAPAPTKRGSAHHLALEVPDAAASVAALEAKPYRKQYTQAMEVRTGVNRRRQVNLFDPDGTRTELMEPVTVDGKPAESSKVPPPH
jgi:catechol 2,3-dioxygenase-like lactoylglutathione lyase family enzyme